MMKKEIIQTPLDLFLVEATEHITTDSNKFPWKN